MLKRIYIDNFRCLVNFELSVDGINLFLGPNGTGKSAVFDVLRKIQEFVRGRKVMHHIFNADDCTRWQTSSIQRFELEIEGNGGTYKYELSLEHEQDLENKYIFVKQERLFFDNQILLKVESGEVELYHEDSSGYILQQFSLNMTQSVLPLIMPTKRTIKMNRFKEIIARFIIVKIHPTLMYNGSYGDTHGQDGKLRLLVSRHVSGSEQNYSTDE